MKVLSLLLVASMFMAGCADLIIRDEDSGATIAGKTVSRILLCAASICASELEISLINEREARQAAAQQGTDNWNRAIGRLTYDEALRQLGPPSSVAEGNDIFVAVWQSGPGPTIWIPGPSMGLGPTYLGAQAPGHRLELTFSRTSKLLTFWRTW